MSTIEDIEYLRLLIWDTSTDSTQRFFTDGQILALIRKASTFKAAAALAWGVKAGKYAILIDISESGAERKLSQMYRQAASEAKRWQDQALQELELISKGTRIGPQIGSPWGSQVALMTRRMSMQSMLIGDFSRGPMGMIFFVDVLSGPVGSGVIEDTSTTLFDDEYPIRIIRGEPWSLDTVYKQPGGDPVDLSGWSAKFLLPVENSLATLTESTGIALGGTAGTVSVSLSAAETQAIPQGLYEYRMTLTSPSPKVYQFLRGIAEVANT